MKEKAQRIPLEFRLPSLDEREAEDRLSFLSKRVEEGKEKRRRRKKTDSWLGKKRGHSTNCRSVVWVGGGGGWLERKRASGGWGGWFVWGSRDSNNLYLKKRRESKRF